MREAILVFVLLIVTVMNIVFSIWLTQRLLTQLEVIYGNLTR